MTADSDTRLSYQSRVVGSGFVCPVKDTQTSHLFYRFAIGRQQSGGILRGDLRTEGFAELTLRLRQLVAMAAGIRIAGAYRPRTAPLVEGVP